jgi:hypothetical protein
MMFCSCHRSMSLSRSPTWTAQGEGCPSLPGRAAKRTAFVCHCVCTCSSALSVGLCVRITLGEPGPCFRDVWY